jgi:hypothetical protein
MAVVGQDGVDPVAQQRAQPHQLRPVPQHRPQLAHRRRRDPGLRQQVSAQQLRQDRRIDLVNRSFFSPAEAIALHCSGCTRCGAKP